jgi:hypothetical protein
MISVAELDNIARARIEDAKALLMAIWRVESRYNVVGTVQRPDATTMIQAAEELVAVL